MSDNLSITTRNNAGDMEFMDKGTGAVALGVRNGAVVDLSGALGVNLPAFMGQETVVSLTLTAAQVDALHGTPITLLAAPGAGMMIDVSRITYDFVYGSAQFATSTGVINLYYGSGGTAIGTNGIATAIVKGTANTMVGDSAAFPGNTSGVASASILNKSVVIQNPSATEYTVGTGCTLTVIVKYRVISGLS